MGARGVLLSLGAAFLGASCGAQAPPPERALNPHVLAIAGSYPTNGTHRYHWPRSGPWLGFTRTLVYDGETLGEGDPEGRCHCSGLTFEVYLRAVKRACGEQGVPFRVGDLDAAGLRRFCARWYGTDGDRGTLATALVGGGLGRRVTAPDEARAGDFVQLWRSSGSGHSCVLLGWEREGGEIVGLRYWSTQAYTNGIGERSERFVAHGGTVLPDEIRVVRAFAPPFGR